MVCVVRMAGMIQGNEGLSIELMHLRRKPVASKESIFISC